MKTSFLDRWLKDKPGEERGLRKLVVITILISTITMFALLIFNFIYAQLSGDLSPVRSDLHRQAILVMGILSLATLIPALRGNILPARVLIPTLILISMTFFMIEGGGVFDPSIVGFAALLVVASLFLGSRGTLIYGVLSSLAISIIGLLEISGKLPLDYSKLWLPQNTIVTITLFVATALVTIVFTRRLEAKVREARQNEIAQIEANKELRELQELLEERIRERTVALEDANENSQRRAGQLQAISDVSRAITLVQNLEELFPRVTTYISNRFGYYHTGIFLLDEEGKYAVLRASNSEGGKQMLAREHKLQVEATSLVGYATSHGEPRVASDVGTDATHFDNPDLPETRSEMVLPLKIGHQVIGALDVQSTEPDAFHQEDIEVLSILADQVSIAIENTRLFERTRQALSESRAYYQKFVRQEWARFTSQAESFGYKYTQSGLDQLSQPLDKPEIQQATKSGDIVITAEEKNDQPTLATPIKLRGELLGILNVKASDPSRKWSPDEIALIQAIADRIALALENARLFSSAQKLASKERAISEITAKIGSTISLRNILQTAAEELGRTLPGSEVVIQFKPEEK